MVYAESGRRYGPEDLALAEDLAARAALAINNADLYRERDHIARTLQQSLLPPELPRIQHVEVAARYEAAGAGNEVGGDFYDVFETSDGNWVALIGDVCGKGPEAAAVTGLARHTVRAAAMREHTPSRVLEVLNEALLEQRGDQVFCTVAFLRLHPTPSGTRITVCVGGHPLPLVLRGDGSVETVGRPGTLVGIFPDPEFHDQAVDLAPGDAVVLFTDGVTEEHGTGGVFGRDRLSEVLRRSVGMSANGLAEAIQQAVTGFRPEPLRDDVAILVVKAAGP
jgi:serine phosphatase RsbU (regulator of sigma subunit)